MTIRDIMITAVLAVPPEYSLGDVVHRPAESKNQACLRVVCRRVSLSARGVVAAW